MYARVFNDLKQSISTFWSIFEKYFTHIGFTGCESWIIVDVQGHPGALDPTLVLIGFKILIKINADNFKRKM